MAKIRINKLALELKIQNDQIIDELLKKDIPVKNYMSSIDEEAADYIRSIFDKEFKKELEKKAAKAKAKKPVAKAKAKAPTTVKAATKKKAVAKSSDDDDEEKKQDDAKPAKEKEAAKAKTAKTTAKAKGKPKSAESKDKPKDSKPKRPVSTKPADDKKTDDSDHDSSKKEPRRPSLKIIKKEEKAQEEAEKEAKKKEAKAAKPAPAEAPTRSRKSVKPGREKTEQKPAAAQESAPPQSDEAFEKVQLTDKMSVRELAEKLKCSANDIIKELMGFGILATINQSLDADLATKIADKRGFEVEIVDEENEIDFEESEQDLVEDRIPRPPIVTIMGHVDHGKTSLLDAIRETNLTEQEKGGITQHIGAYQAKIKDSLITFLDTPGHEAFTAMRARGAQVTDIVVLVVAADDGIKPQTEEAIDHAHAANVPMVVAINKIDKPDAKPEEVKKQLADLGLLPEDWGGQTIFSEVSAKQNVGIDHLLEMILLQAEIMELKANPKLMGQGVVIESKLDKRRGPVATIIVQNGTLNVGNPYIVGPYFGKVRALIDDHGNKVNEAPPAYPVEVLGLPDVPRPGDRFFVVRDERKARQMSNLKLQKMREATLTQTSRVTLDDLHRQILEGTIKDLNLIIKADVQGSIQAVKEAFSKLDNEEVRVKVIHGAVGGVTESDVLLSTASNAIIIGFNVRPTDQAAQLAEKENVDIRLYSVIYDAINDMKEAMDGMLTPKYKERILGRAEVRKVYTIPKVGVIAGCMVLTGNIERNTSARLIRDNVVVYEGKVQSLRRFKDDVKEVPSGYECGMALERYQDMKQGDIIEPFMMEEIKN